MPKTFAIADLHGRHDLLLKAIKKVEKYTNGGTVVFLGDYIDRGPDSKLVLDRLMAGPVFGNWKWVCLAGNHEMLMVRKDDKDYGATWVLNGGVETLESFDGNIAPTYFKWLGKLPFYYKDKHRFFVHAGVDPKKKLKHQTEEDLLWSRNTGDFGFKKRYLVHGHTPIKDGPLILEKRINLDTRAYATGRLFIAVFDDDKPGKPVDMLHVHGDQKCLIGK